MEKPSIQKYLALEEDLRRYRKAMNEAMEIMLDQEVSLYPIFIMHQQNLEMGVPLIEASEKTGIWSVQASSLEEFVVKNILFTDKIDEFKTLYKKHERHLCLFVLSELGAQFIFYPRQEEIYKEYGSLN
ncbi:MAG: hypothetical protein IPH93_02720 [Saprospiraceae bacterium]|nr:hypothetical protein [Saprospiraceae bacterium]MBK7810405.1 hypothetical protein [Saprospiraceae bacterium]MBK9630001.1 hypothetical protein [Saprospiraceae bacterium]